jgi:hypothetical protein
MKKNYIAAITRIFVVLIFTGCAPTTPTSENGGLPSNAQNYQVEIISLTEPIYETIRTENIDQPNCSGTSDVDNVIERTMGINHSIELGLGLTVDIDGKLELFGTGVDLGAAISSELGYQYGVTESISRSITVRAAPKSHIIHTVKLSEVWESGTARVTTNGESIDIPFRSRANFSIDLLESVPVDCSTGQTEENQPITQTTPDAPLYDDFESNIINSNKWGEPFWGNPQQYTPVQFQGALKFEVSKDWFDWAIKQPKSIEEFYTLVTLENAGGAFGISIGGNPTRYNLMLRGDGQVITWDEKKELDYFDVSGTCCPYTHLLGAKADGERLHFYVDNKEIVSYPLNGYANYGGLQIVGGGQTIALVKDVWVKFTP